MSVLLLRLAGPLQSWGSAARFARRTTEAAPTKSGVIGLLAAALGRPRSVDPSDLAALRFGVRVDQRGRPLRDFQTAHDMDTGGSLPVSERFYLADAVFVAALEGPDDQLFDLQQAVRSPGFLPYLGRRSCPPSQPIDLRLCDDAGLERALKTEPWQAADWHQWRRRKEQQVELEVLVEADRQDGRVDTLRDQPLSFDPAHRRYGLRGIRSFPVTVPNPRASQQVKHDPTTVLRSE